MAIGVAIASAIGMSLISEVIFRPLVKRGAMIMSFVVAMGMSMLFTDMFSRQLNKGVSIGFPKAFTGSGSLVGVGLASVSTGQLVTLIGCVAAVIVFLWLVYRTKQGRAFRVIAQQPVIARILGIPTTRSSVLSWAIAGLMAGISAIFLAMALGWASAAMAGTLWIKVLAISLFAGMGNLVGGLYGALILGFAEVMVLSYIPGDWSSAIAFGMIIIVIVFKPRGLFGVTIA
jgi:branched-subunit amino acid ABC-type transport system permease component